MVKKIPRYVCSFWHDPRTWQTDGQTDRRKNRQTPHDSIDRACIASRGKNASQHVPVYLQQFPSHSNHDCKKSPFLYTPAFIFCLPWGRPCGNHAKRCMNEKNNSVLAKPLPACTHLSSTVSQLFELQVQKIAVFTHRSPHFCFSWRRPRDYYAICCMDGKTIQCLSNCRVLSLSDCKYSLNPLSQTWIDRVGRYRIRCTFKLSYTWRVW